MALYYWNFISSLFLNSIHSIKTPIWKSSHPIAAQSTCACTHTYTHTHTHTEILLLW